jgi:hypothetical protein
MEDTFTEFPTYTVALIVRYHGATDHRGSRVSIRCPQSVRTVWLSYDHSLPSAAAIALRWCEQNQIAIKYECDLGNETLLVVDPDCKGTVAQILG